MTPDPSPRRQAPRPTKHTRTKMAPQRELEETLQLDKRKLSAQEMASELFVHGLLMSRAENAQGNAEQLRETRIATILQRIEGDGSGVTEVNPR